MTMIYCKKWQEGKQTAITRTLLTLEMLTKNLTATCTQNQEHFTILLEQHRWWSKVSCTIYIIYIHGLQFHLFTPTFCFSIRIWLFTCKPHTRFLSYAKFFGSMDNCDIQCLSLYYVVMLQKKSLHYRTLNLEKLYKKQATPHFAGCHISMLYELVFSRVWQHILVTISPSVLCFPLYN
jgi:hypothetical protein